MMKRHALVIWAIPLALSVVLTASGSAESPVTEPQTAVRTEDELYADLAASGIDKAAFLARYTAWRDGQNPFIAVQDLADLVTAKRDSLRDGSCEFTVETEFEGSVHQLNVEWAFSDTKAFRAEEGAVAPGLAKSIHRAYNGNTVQRYYGESREASIWPFSGYSEFNDFNDPLALVMLRDMHRDFDLPFYWVDLAAMLKDLGCIQEATEEVDGRECLVVLGGMPLLWKVYLDTEKDFSVLRIQHYNSPPSSGEEVEREVMLRIDMKDLRDYGNGVWLPTRAEGTYYQTGEVTWRLLMTLKRASFNAGVKSEVFEQAIPSGVSVTDFVHHVVYRDLANPEEVEHFLDLSLFSLPEEEGE